MAESDESSVSDDEGGRGSVNLTLQRLQSMHAVGSNKGDSSKFSKHGASKTRVKKALHNPVCSCRCKVPFQTLLRVCLAFWMLNKQAQDTVLWSLQREHPGSKKDWHIEGVALAVCLFVFRTVGVQSGMDAFAGGGPEKAPTMPWHHLWKGWEVTSG